jgi:hypothetical protein
MPIYTIYKDDKFKSILNASEEFLALNLEENDSYVEGNYPEDDYYIKDNTFFPYPEKPNYPCNFNKDTEEWVWDEELSWINLRHERDTKLQLQVDPIVSNPLRWNSFSEEQQLNYSNYRDALLNLPQVTEDPRYPVWPTPPE